MCTCIIILGEVVPTVCEKVISVRDNNLGRANRIPCHPLDYCTFSICCAFPMSGSKEAPLNNAPVILNTVSDVIEWAARLVLRTASVGELHITLMERCLTFVKCSWAMSVKAFTAWKSCPRSFDINTSDSVTVPPSQSLHF